MKAFLLTLIMLSAGASAFADSYTATLWVGGGYYRTNDEEFAIINNAARACKAGTREEANNQLAGQLYSITYFGTADACNCFYNWMQTQNNE